MKKQKLFHYMKCSMLSLTSVCCRKELAVEYVRSCPPPHFRARVLLCTPGWPWTRRLRVARITGASCHTLFHIYLNLGDIWQKVVAYIFNPAFRRPRQADLHVLSLRPACSAEWVPRQLGLHREALSYQNKQTNKNLMLAHSVRVQSIMTGKDALLC